MQLQMTEDYLVLLDIPLDVADEAEEEPLIENHWYMQGICSLDLNP